MIILAHDGSIYGDWVARYAMHFATGEPDRKLLVLHVEDGQVHPEIVTNRFRQLAGECDSFDVEFLPEQIPLGTTVYRTLRQAIPPDLNALLVCGTRVKPRRQNYLAGTVAEKLLRQHQCPVLALRVVQPGLLGNPHDLLLPLAGHLHGFRRIAPILSRIAPRLRALHLFRGMRVNPLRHPYLSPAMEQALRQKGHADLAKVDDEMRDSLGTIAFGCDHWVAITTDWANEVLVQASRHKVQLMLLGVSERNLAYRVFHSAAIETILRGTPCDVGIYRGP